MEEEKSMTYEEAIAALSAYRDETGKSQRVIARELGISDGLVSAFLSGSYKTPHTIIPKVEALVGQKKKRELLPKEPGFVETSVYHMVTEAIAYSHLRGRLSVVYGDAGVGKTTAIKEYLRRNDLAIGIRVSPSYAGINGVNELIAAQLGIKERVARRIYAEIVEKLRKSGRIIIIDEAQYLGIGTLNQMYCLGDEAEIGITLIGNHSLYKKILGGNNNDCAQISSRAAFRRLVRTGDTTREDIGLIFRDAALDGEAVDLLFRIARTSYGVRGAVNVFVNTVANYGDATAAEIAKVAKAMNVK